jgi:hypothetical protein
MTSSNMDGLYTPLAAMRGRILCRVTMALAAATAALLLSGCDTQRIDKLEERVTAVEAKAAAAEKRAKTAEAIVSETQTISQPDAVPQNDLNPSNDDTPDQSNNNGEGEGEAPPPPMADNGKG